MFLTDRLSLLAEAMAYLLKLRGRVEPSTQSNVRNRTEPEERMLLTVNRVVHLLHHGIVGVGGSNPLGSTTSKMLDSSINARFL